MKKLRKIINIFAIMCASTTMAYSQDCISILKQATELQNNGDYCQAKQYYQMYQNCNADADVSTEIAMCVNRHKIQFPGVNCPDFIPTRDNNSNSTRTPTNTSSDNHTEKPTTSVGKFSRFKLGFNGGLLYPTEQEKGDKTYLYFGGGINAEFLASRRLGIGLSTGYYAYEIAGNGAKATSSLIPSTLPCLSKQKENQKQSLLGYCKSRK